MIVLLSPWAFLDLKVALAPYLNYFYLDFEVGDGFYFGMTLTGTCSLYFQIGGMIPIVGAKIA